MLQVDFSTIHFILSAISIFYKPL